MTTEPIIWFPITDRQRELAAVGVSDPRLLDDQEIRELAVINLLQHARDVTAFQTWEPDPDNLWPDREWHDDEDDEPEW